MRSRRSRQGETFVGELSGAAAVVRTPCRVGWGANPNIAIRMHSNIGVCTPTYAPITGRGQHELSLAGLCAGAMTLPRAWGYRPLTQYFARTFQTERL